MNRRNWLLVGAILIELAAGSALLLRHRTQPLAPPIPDLADGDPLVAAHIRDRAAACKTPEDWAALGEIYTAYGYFAEAEACCRVASNLRPDRADWAHDLGFALELIGLPTEANSEYERAISLGHPDPAGCWYYIGRNHLRLENTDAARAAFEKAGGQPSARYEVARLLVRCGKPAEAIPIIDRVAAECPAAVQPPLLRHRIELLSGDPAAVSSGALSTITPGRLPTPFDRDWKRLEQAHDGLGLARELKNAMALLDRGDMTAAVPALKEVFRQNWDPLAADLLAEAEEQGGNRDEAIRLLEQAIARAGPSPHLLIRLGEVYDRAGRSDRAVPCWTRATWLGIGTDVKDAYRHLATRAEKNGDAAAARRYHAMAYLSAGHEAFWHAQPDPTKILLEEALARDPNLAPAWFYVGEMHRLNGETDAARKAYQKCLSINPDFGRAITGLALLPR